MNNVTTTEQTPNYADLRKINVNEHVEKKNNLSYLSWAWAVDMLFQADETASWDYRWFNDQPYLTVGNTHMVFCTVRAFGRERTAQLPIMDYKNKPIQEFTTFDLNTTMQRCLAKAISLHGIGLYIYAGEDLPPDEGGKKSELRPEPKPETAKSVTQVAWEALTEAEQADFETLAMDAKTMLNKGDVEGAFNHIEDLDMEADHKAAFWYLFDSKQRSALKKEGERRRNGG